MARATTKSINKALADAGIKAEIHKAPEGYCYFYGDDVEYADGTSVWVPRLSDYTVEQWVEYAQEFKNNSTKRKADLDEAMACNPIENEKKKDQYVVYAKIGDNDTYVMSGKYDALCIANICQRAIRKSWSLYNKAPVKNMVVVIKLNNSFGPRAVMPDKISFEEVQAMGERV